MVRGFCLNHYRCFENGEERRNWQNPDVILASIGLKPGFTFLDIGCGDGFFAIPAAKIVGEKGVVYGLDNDEEAIDRLGERARAEGLLNLRLKVGEAEETVLCKGCADIVFFGIVLHDFDSAPKVLSNAKKMLKPDGRLVDLDWKKEPMSLGPPLRIRFSEAEAANLIEKVGLKIKTVNASEPYHYIIVARH
jgi:ubiquinone/menaquinone biosynthesis C-methylase UbiE